MSLRENIDDALKQAVKAKDKRRISTLRLINAAIKDRDIAARTSGADDGVADDEVLQILAKMVKQREESAATYEEAGRLELAEQERDETAIIREFMPRQFSEDEIRSACSDVVDAIEAKGLKDMGRCMGALKERYAGQMDFSKASGIVKEMLR